MSYYIFDENTYATFDPSRLVYEEGKHDVGPFKVSYFNLKYKNDEGAACFIKVKTPVLTTPFGINKNQFGKIQLTVNVPKGDLYTFLLNFQQAVKEYICNNIKQFNKQSIKSKISTDEFNILSTAFDIIKLSKDSEKYDDTMVFDFSSEFDQRNAKFFDNTKTLIDNISYADSDQSYDMYIANVVPKQTQVRIVFRINSVCMYGESRGRKFTLKKNPMQVLIVEKPASNDVCEFIDDFEENAEVVDENDNDDEWKD